MASTVTQTLVELMYDGRQVRTVLIDGEPWWVAADVLVILELDRKALERIDGGMGKGCEFNSHPWRSTEHDHHQ